ncbi:MAG: PSD1 and planctomycete cytochrome C domain-containing protein, partial [Tepidisphaeraceae bacterium]
MQRCAFILVLAVVVSSLAAAAATPEPKIVFNRDIRPILSQNCFACHGFDKNKRKADLRLDTRQGMFRDHDGVRPVVPGKPGESELYRRVTSDDAEEHMPPAKSGKKLTPAQVELIRHWIEQGAEYQAHWAYAPATRPAVPKIERPGFVRGDIDRFILARLQQEKLEPGAEADPRTLVRRLYLDLLGLPPTPKQIVAYIGDARSDKYERLVDELLASPQYGERMAIYWLDLVRYADSIGYHSDNARNVAPYRDWVIAAFNSNKRFDRFTAEQIAGDLLPDAGVETRIASGYNRLLKTTEEGGAQPKEYAAKYIADRVRNFSSVWLGSTMMCCECHDHKFDPFAARDFYSLGAFFADVKEPATGPRERGMPLPTHPQDQQFREFDAQLDGLRKLLSADRPELAAAQTEWEQSLKTPEQLKGLPEAVQDALKIPADKRGDPQKAALRAHFRNTTPLLQKLREAIAMMEKAREELDGRILKTLVTETEPPRPIRILPRGNWMDDSGAEVQPAVPEVLGTLPVQGRRPTRLDLARWTVSRDNPIATRAMVNRLWRMYFGIGISKNLDDLGVQGEWPVHPELLEWLSCEFMDSGWDIKHMVRLMITSGTYRQTSVVQKAMRERDPFNRLCARQSRFRLDAEIVRDDALAISGLLSLRMGGPGVRPYQPAGYWDYLNFPRRDWEQDHGENLYRRTVYTWWQRTFLHPTLLVFDASSRDECVAERTRSNTPQQAMVLLNDPIFVEAARVFAERTMHECAGSPQNRAGWAFEQATGRRPTDAEAAVLVALFDKHHKEYTADADAAKKLVATGERPAEKDL